MDSQVLAATWWGVRVYVVLLAFVIAAFA